MDSSVSVISNPVVALVAFLGVIVLLLFLIAKWRWHVFLALLVPLLLFGFIPKKGFLKRADNDEIDPTWILSLNVPPITIFSLRSKSGNDSNKGFQNFSLKDLIPVNSFIG